MEEIENGRDKRCVGLMIFGGELSTRERGEDDLLGEDEKDVVGLLPLTPDNLEMLQIPNGESGQKGGRKGKGGRTRRGILGEAQ